MWRMGQGTGTSYHNLRKNERRETMIKGNEYVGKLQVGQRVHSILYGGRDGIISAINGEQSPESIRSLGGGCVVIGGRANIDVVFEEYVSRGIPECIVRGVQWRIDNVIETPEKIREAIKQANAATDAKKEAARLEEIKKADLRASLPSKYPYLTPINKTMSSHALGAKNLRIELKRAFPAVKFSVRSDSYSGGSSIDVSWTDGPLTDEVKTISDKYQECDFDGMDDSTHYRHTAWPEVFGGAKYVMEQRHESAELTLKVAKAMGFDLPSGESDNMGNLPGLTGEQSQMIYRETRQTRA
jgi:hypothetical protein